MQTSFRPFVRKCREYVDETFMTLNKHFSDAGCASEISVNLERRVSAEQVRVGAAVVAELLRRVVVACG